MAQVVFVHDGASIDYTSDMPVGAGDVIVQGDLIGVAKQFIPANQPGALAVTGVFDFPKAIGSGTALAVGTIVYWDSENEVATATAAGNKLLGKVVRAATNSDARVRVRLTQ